MSEMTGVSEASCLERPERSEHFSVIGIPVTRSGFMPERARTRIEHMRSGRGYVLLSLIQRDHSDGDMDIQEPDMPRTRR